MFFIIRIATSLLVTVTASVLDCATSCPTCPLTACPIVGFGCNSGHWFRKCPGWWH
ncbi:hypothetical protein PR002_g32233 [Phytophthora rubi]|uniref:CCHC-type domain-containing protein n=1 Tax=Phytophthora rubi TaxID=129364 RepID=A0A6A3GBR1_9STRA|nr:hypothetical protein PR002_g32233 [Phytophthora rubi]